MELKALWDVVRRWWWLIALPTVVALVLALPSLQEVIRPPVSYRVIVRFTASQPPQAPSQQRTFSDQSYIPWLASEYVVINLAAWLRTESFAREVANGLSSSGQTQDVNALRGAIASDSVRSVLTLYLDWPDPEQIKAIAAAAITALSERSQIYFPQLDAAQVKIIALDDVQVAPLSAPITARLAPLLRILIGLAAGIGLAFLADYLDPTIRTRREVETLELPILGEIPAQR